MAWETALYAHPQGARLTRVMLTRKDAGAEITADVYWREHEDDIETNIATVTIEAGKRIGFSSLQGQVMRPMDSLVQVRSGDPKPVGLGVVVGFGR